jgi:hypothetical protein
MNGELRAFEWTALHEAGHLVVARLYGVRVTGATLVARQIDVETWVRDSSGTGIQTTGTHHDGRVRPEWARPCLAVALAGSLAERVVREQELPEVVTIDSIIASTDTTDRAEAHAAEAALDEPDVTTQVAFEVFALLAESRDALKQERQRLLGFLDRSAGRPECHGIRIEAEPDGAHTYVEHCWDDSEIVVEVVFGIHELRTDEGAAILGLRQDNGEWRVANVPPEGSGFHYRDLVAFDAGGTALEKRIDGGCVTLRARRNRPLTKTEYAALAAARAVVSAGEDDDTIVLSVPHADLPWVRREIDQAGWAREVAHE